MKRKRDIIVKAFIAVGRTMTSVGNGGIPWNIPLMLVVLLFGSFAYGKVIYVDDDAAGANDGTSWENAYLNLQDALADADSAPKPVELCVAQGVYKPDQGSGIISGEQDTTFQLINGVTLMGGYAGFWGLDPDARNVEAYISVLSGDLSDNDVELSNPSDLEEEPTRAENSHYVVVGSGTDDTAVLDGFIITGGGGMKNESGSPTVSNCTFCWNCAKDYLGGGMLNDSGSDPTLTNCAFMSNWAYYGGGIHSRGNPLLLNCIFMGNATRNNGAGMDNGGDPILINCVFFGNAAGFFGGGMENTGRPLLTNCTFTNNSAGEQGGGMNSVESSPHLMNCILWDNTPNEVHGDPLPAIIYSDVQGGWSGQGNIDADPWFDDDLRLFGGSPCIDAGNNSAVPGPLSAFTDCAGNPRIINEKVDMGAYESPTPIFLLSAGWLTVPERQTARFTVALTEAPLETIQVTVARHSGDRDIAVESGGLLTFTAQNFSEPQTVILGAAEDSDNLDGAAQIRIETPGFLGIVLTASEWDNETALYVDVDAPGANNGSSWTDAFNHLQDALSWARVNPEVQQIHVAQGVYTPDQGGGNTPGDRGATFQLIDAVTLKGGFAGFGEPDPNAWDVDLYESALSGDLLGNDIELENPQDMWRGPTRDDNSFHVVTSNEDNPTAILDGFTIVGCGRGYGPGSAGLHNRSSITVLDCTFTLNHGMGMVSYDAHPTLINCTFSGNLDSGVYSSGSPTLINCTFSGNTASDGGGMTSRGNPTLVNCTFSGNVARGDGGGMLSHGSPTLVNCTIVGNSAGDIGGTGGGVSCDSATLTGCTISGNFSDEGGGVSCSSATLTNCTIMGNSARRSGGGMSSNGSLTLANCMIAGNSAGHFGGVLWCHSESGPTLTNCTIAENSAGQGGGVVYCPGESSPALTGCIVWGNSADWIRRFGEATALVSVSYSNIKGGWPGVGNIDADPLFADPDGPDNIPGTEDDDLRLSLFSPCVDAGDPNYVSEPNETDLAGNARIVNGRIDMGAHEFQGLIYVDDNASADPGSGDPVE